MSTLDLSRHLERVTDPGDGEQILWVGRVRFQSLAQTADEDTEIFFFTAVFRTPDFIKEHGMSQDFVSIEDKLLEQSIPGRG